MLKLYNTMSRTVTIFRPNDDTHVSLYACGPTVYDYAHIGNLRTYIFEDILKRTLQYEGYEVKHVINVTDVGHLVSDADTGEDKMEIGSQRANKSAWEIADFFWQAFRHDLARLNALPPTLYCRATDHIAEQIALIRQLEDKGLTYVIDDGVYYDTSKFPQYGKLARLDIEGLQAGSRIEMVPGKRHITDFALWKFSPRGKQRQMEWESPWGVGFPGWHIECSAMAMKYLGERIDIHCGGVDHIPVHHTNEIAQTEGVLGHRWVNWWVHGEFIVLGGDEKMAKSSGKFITLQTVIEQGIDPLAFRYFCLNAHYRSLLTFTWEALQAAATAFARLKNHVVRLKSQATAEEAVSQAHLDAFVAAAMDDLNMPRAVAAMWELLRDETVAPGSKVATLLEMDAILGLGIAEMEPETATVSDEVAKLVAEREAARERRDFATADRIRDELAAQGIVLEDTPVGTRVRRKG